MDSLVFIATYGAEDCGSYYSYDMCRASPFVFLRYFAKARPMLAFPESVDLHDSYEDCKCFLSKDGLQGFAIEPDGNLVSVFNASDKRSFIKAVRDLMIAEGAIKLDCFEKLSTHYEQVLNAKTASIMSYDMAYDHDEIAAKYRNPDVFFMVITDKPIELREFRPNTPQYPTYEEFHKHAYRDAVKHQNQQILKIKTRAILEE